MPGISVLPHRDGYGSGGRCALVDSVETIVEVEREQFEGVDPRVEAGGHRGYGIELRDIDGIGRRIFAPIGKILWPTRNGSPFSPLPFTVPQVWMDQYPSCLSRGGSDFEILVGVG